MMKMLRKKYIKASFCFYFYVSIFIFSFFLSACYSFTGGSIPSHLKTLKIESVTDRSGFGNPEYKVDLETELLAKFRKDNSFEISDDLGDAKLVVAISSINEVTQTISAGELETEKKITVTTDVEYYDNVNQKQIWKKTFSNYALFDVNNALTARNEAIKAIIPQIAEDIMLAVVSGW